MTFPLNRQIAESFVRDADKVLAALEAVLAAGKPPDDDENLETYRVNVHAMKSALANVGEDGLSQVARRLEKAGQGRDWAAIAAETPAFLEALRLARDRIKPGEDEGREGAEAGDPEFWREKLLAVQASCAAYDNRAAEDALEELKLKSWPRPARDLLNDITAHLLHSDFEIAAALIAERLESGCLSAK